MLLLPGGPASIMSARTLRMANLWKLVRTDAVTFRFTDHNSNLTFAGEVYTPANGFSHSAEKKNSGGHKDAMDMVGIISSDAIKTDDLIEGLYDGASLTHYLIDWRYPFAGSARTSKFFVDRITHDGEKFNAELSSMGIKLLNSIGDVYNRDCGYDLGDADCKYNIAAETKTACQVSSVVTQQLSFVATHAGFASKPDQWFGLSSILWTTGNNAGRKSEVKTSTAASGTSVTFTLLLKTSKAIQVNDQFTAKPGCDKLKLTCSSKFANVVNFGGFPYLPGEDILFRVLPE